MSRSRQLSDWLRSLAWLVVSRMTSAELSGTRHRQKYASGWSMAAAAVASRAGVVSVAIEKLKR